MDVVQRTGFDDADCGSPLIDLQGSKGLVRSLYEGLSAAAPSEFEAVLQRHTSADFLWRGMHPFNDLGSVEAVANEFWAPLSRSLTSMQRRENVFMAGADDSSGVWVVSMGHLMGLFDQDWLGIPATGRTTFLPYVDFHRVADHKIVETVSFFDILSLMLQAGQNPLPVQTGAAVIAPGPRTHDGLMLDSQDADESTNTRKLINQMIGDLLGSDMSSSGSELESTWHDDMCWFGPAGIGATFTIGRYVQQHQFPFNDGLTDIAYDDHDCLITEGRYGGLFCWTGFTMKPTGGFMGLPATNSASTMRVVDIYRRDGDKLAENWVFIDILHFLHQQGLDVLGRMRQINRTGT